MSSPKAMRIRHEYCRRAACLERSHPTPRCRLYMADAACVLRSACGREGGEVSVEAVEEEEDEDDDYDDDDERNVLCLGVLGPIVSEIRISLGESDVYDASISVRASYTDSQDDRC